MLKICFTCNSSPWSKFHGGGQIFVHNLAQNLSNLGHKITVIYTGTPSPKNNIPINLMYKLYWTPYIGYPFTAKFRQFNAITILHKIIKLDKKYNFDLINAIGGEASLIPKWCKKNNKKLIFSIEHPDIKAIKPNLRWSNPFESAINILRSRDLMLQKYACAHANGVATPSIFTKLEAIKYFSINEKKIRIIPHGISDEMLSVYQDDNRKKVTGPIVFFGRLEPQKGVDLLIKAYHNLKSNGSLDTQKLLIVGVGPNEITYRKMANKLRISNHVKFLGWKCHCEIMKILSTASVCVLPSRSESFGLSVAETLSQGVPLVTALSGSIPEVVDYGRCGWICESNNVDSLTKAIETAIKNYSESKKKAELGKKFVKSNFTWKQAAKKYEKLYVETMNA